MIRRPRSNEALGCRTMAFQSLFDNGQVELLHKPTRLIDTSSHLATAKKLSSSEKAQLQCCLAVWRPCSSSPAASTSLTQSQLGSFTFTFRLQPVVATRLLLGVQLRCFFILSYLFKRATRARLSTSSVRRLWPFQHYSLLFPVFYLLRSYVKSVAGSIVFYSPVLF
jgi:hypothetical protein